MRLPSLNTLGIRFGSTEYPYSKTDPHKGLDIHPDNDFIIYAPFKGRVIQTPNNGRDGNGTYMYDGADFHGLLHGDRYLVPNGTLVEEGQPIAIMGYTGFVVPAGERGRHLHWCVKRKGLFIDPLALITGGKGAAEGTDMFEGRTAEDWATQAKDAEPWKQAVVHSKAFSRGIEGKVENVTFIMDDLQDFKDRTLAEAPTFVPTASAHQLACEQAVDALEKAFNSK
jgi:hypothetical protein